LSSIEFYVSRSVVLIEAVLHSPLNSIETMLIAGLFREHLAIGAPQPLRLGHGGDV
jgi:hypothetical protein